MSNPCQKHTGTTYAAPVALLVVAFVFSPAVLAVSRPFGYWPLSLAIVGSALCVALAWFNWTKSSQLSIPSIAAQGAKAK